MPPPAANGNTERDGLLSDKALRERKSFMAKASVQIVIPPRCIPRMRHYWTASRPKPEPAFHLSLGHIEMPNS